MLLLILMRAFLFSSFVLLQMLFYLHFLIVSVLTLMCLQFGEL